ncbi:MAG: hypothetical protein EHM23_12210 [Acidobacteria bacterium]|nr:MAG: hypothetical protein EHM23_12210 [Acidobacteriota bacterium]
MALNFRPDSPVQTSRPRRLKMRLFITVVVLSLAGSLCLAQDEFSEVEFSGFYQRVQGFDFQGVQGFEFESEAFNGGGFGFVYNLNPFFGIFSQTSFLGGVEQSNVKLRFINQAQGVKLTKRSDKINVFGKGGIGFVRHVFDFSGQESVDYGTSFLLGGGTEIKIQEGMWLMLDLSRNVMGLPQLTINPDRDKWDSNWIITTGVSFQF